MPDRRYEKTFRPTATWLKGRTSPERLYLETKWGLLIPYEKVADLLKEVLPVSESTNHETVREHLHTVPERMEAELGEERQPDPVKPEVDPELSLPDGPMTVGLDGYVRAAYNEGFFEVIAGRSVVAFLSDGGEDIRQVREYLHPNSEHVIDWFHITMRLTVLQQQRKALEENAARGGCRGVTATGKALSTYCGTEIWQRLWSA